MKNSDKSQVAKKKNVKKKFNFNHLIKQYAHFLSKFPLVVIVVCLLLFGVSLYYSTQIENKSIKYRDVLPDGVDVIETNNLFSDNFGGSSYARFVIEVLPEYSNSNEIRDIREPEVLEFAQKLEKYIEDSEEIEEISSPISIFKEFNNGMLPRTKSQIKDMIDSNPMLSSYISEDNTIMLINLRVYETYDEDSLVYDLESAIESVGAPNGVTVRPAGSSLEGYYVNQELNGDMEKTSKISLIGIVVILIIIFASLKYGLLPLTTIIVGIMWAFGYIGYSGLKMSPATSGVISMIMGIGIDFGIQIITRFRQELAKDKGIENAMNKTIRSTLVPMFTTTLAAVIGFQAMGLGQLSIMKEMGQMMTFGVVFCFLAAITFVPAITVVAEKITFSLRGKKKNV